MASWKPATKEDVLQAIANEAADQNLSPWDELLVEPYECTIERFGKPERAFVVAKTPRRVVYFDDVEDEFATAAEMDGKLLDATLFGPLIFALKAAAHSVE